jgi:mRNA-degrading endonuclease RelE of RelBE toxin-antitoxin system
MAEDSILLTDDFILNAFKLPKNIQPKIWKSILLLMKNDRHPSLHVKQLRTGRKGIMECRIDETYRLIFEPTEKGPMRLWYVAHHDEALHYGSKITEPVPRERRPEVYHDHLLHEIDL